MDEFEEELFGLAERTKELNASEFDDLKSAIKSIASDLNEISLKLKSVDLFIYDLEKKRIVKNTKKKALALPMLLADESDVDSSSKDHLKIQNEQIIAAFLKLSTPESPYINSSDLKEYLLSSYEIPSPHYWMVKTTPKEPERWWKNIYDKAIERLDIMGLIVRSDKTGKKGLYALTKYHMDFHYMDYLLEKLADN